MKNLIILITIIITSAQAKEITVDGVDLITEKLGKKHYVFLKNPKLYVTNESDSDLPENMALDCEKLDRRLENIKDDIEECKATDDSLSCDRASRHIQKIAKERSFSLGAAIQSFRIHEQGGYVNFDVAKIAKRLNTKVSNIIMKLEYPLNVDAEIRRFTYFAGDSSRTNLIHGVLDFHNKMQVNEFQNGFYTHNRIIACDIQSGDVKIRVDYQNIIRHKEAISQAKKQLGFNLYNSLKRFKVSSEDTKLVQAALVGDHIGKNLKVNSDLTVREVFTKLIDTRGTKLNVKIFQNQAQFEEEVFPDEYFTEYVYQKYMLEAR